MIELMTIESILQKPQQAIWDAWEATGSSEFSEQASVKLTQALNNHCLNDEYKFQPSKNDDNSTLIQVNCAHTGHHYGCLGLHTT